MFNLSTESFSVTQNNKSISLCDSSYDLTSSTPMKKSVDINEAMSFLPKDTPSIKIHRLEFVPFQTLRIETPQQNWDPVLPIHAPNDTYAPTSMYDFSGSARYFIVYF